MSAIWTTAIFKLHGGAIIVKEEKFVSRYHFNLNIVELQSCFGKHIIFYRLKHYVTLTAPHCIEQQNLYISTSHKTAILAKPGHILGGNCSLVSPLMSCDCSASTL